MPNDTQLLQKIIHSQDQGFAFVNGAIARYLASFSGPPMNIGDAVSEIHAAIFDPVSGLAALQVQLATLQATLDLDNTAILLAVSDCQQTGSPVTFPATPPSGYAPTSAAAVTAAVWAQPGGDDMAPLSDYVVKAGAYAAGNIQHTAFVAYENPLWVWHGFANLYSSYLPDPPPVLDFSAVTPGQTLLAALTAQNPTWGFAWLDNPGGYVVATTLPPAGLGGGTAITDAEFRLLIDALNGLGSNLVAPIWPGLANVTMGSPVAIATGVTVTTPMQGVLIDITAVPQKQGSFLFDTSTSWRNIGALSFVDDNGQNEFPQTLGFTSAVYLPKCMAVAQAVQLRSSAGVAGTITPFTIP